MGHQEVFVFRKGDRVVHPQHGAAVVEDLVEMEKSGEQRTYVKLRPPHGWLYRRKDTSRGPLRAAGATGRVPPQVRELRGGSVTATRVSIVRTDAVAPRRGYGAVAVWMGDGAGPGKQAIADLRRVPG
jgi:hypothetical protein